MSQSTQTSSQKKSRHVQATVNYQSTATQATVKYHIGIQCNLLAADTIEESKVSSSSSELETEGSVYQPSVDNTE